MCLSFLRTLVFSLSRSSRVLFKASLLKFIGSIHSCRLGTRERSGPSYAKATEGERVCG